jgi:hypothetical protein
MCFSATQHREMIVKGLKNKGRPKEKELVGLAQRKGKLLAKMNARTSRATDNASVVIAPVICSQHNPLLPLIDSNLSQPLPACASGLFVPDPLAASCHRCAPGYSLQECHCRHRRHP